MKRTLAGTVTLLLFASLVCAEEFRLEPTQNPDAPYRLFNTQNTYTLLKLDTSGGRIWQVQWDMKITSCELRRKSERAVGRLAPGCGPTTRGRRVSVDRGDRPHKGGVCSICSGFPVR
jgi:hypothetical protein